MIVLLTCRHDVFSYRQIPGEGAAFDPSFYHTPLAAFKDAPQLRQSWRTHVHSFYDAPVALQYDGLDPEAAYTLRLVYVGSGSAIQGVGSDNGGGNGGGSNCSRKEGVVAAPTLVLSDAPVHTQISIGTTVVRPFQAPPVDTTMLSYAVPQKEIAGGSLLVQCVAQPGQGGTGRNCRLAEVWLSTTQPKG